MRRGGRQMSENPSLREVFEELRWGRIGPIQRFVLWAAGVPRPLLALVPVEKTEFLVQGTGVLVAGSMASVSAFLASGMIVDPTPSTPIRVTIGLLVGSLIFTIDRLLVRTTLRPYVFPPDVLHALWDPTSDAKWYDVLSGSIYHESIGARLRSFVAVVAKVFVRFAIAVFVGYLVADVIVIYAFRPTITSRASTILVQQQRDARTAAQTELDTANAKIKAERTQLADLEQKNPAVKKDGQLITSLTTQVANAKSDYETLTTWADDEENGVLYKPPALSDGTRLPRTTGKRGCIQECHQDHSRARAAHRNYKALNQQLTDAKAALQAALRKAGASTTASSAQIDHEQATATATYAKAIAKANALSTKPEGILILKEALDQLETDKTPWRQTPSPEKQCSSSFRWLCELKRSAFPSTPLGAYVGVFRAILILIDTIPILIKIYASLRNRRPYDVLVAALEEVSIADATNKLDFELNSLGASMEDRAAERRGRRRGSGSRLIRESKRARSRERRDRARTNRNSFRREPGRSSVARNRSFRDWRRAVNWAKRGKADAAQAGATRSREESPWSEPRTYKSDTNNP